ncbi:hypothetical protein [Streptomyces minutiscleroticus]|uniref:hypothetical protein n=1 Tax=Streptomyces minutiscleroticus TaxID=68238 RepID=UPI003320F844
MTTILWAVLLPLQLLWTVGIAGYFFVLVPRRWRVPYQQSLELLHSDDREDLQRADRLLGEAVNAGPRGRTLNRIRFAQAGVRAMLGTHDPARYADAATVLHELITAEGRTEHTAYLELWVQARLENHSRVTDLYAEHRTLLDTRPEPRRIAAASHLHLAAGHWRRRETDGALHHFDRVRELGELTDRIPPEVDNLPMVKGVQAVFDGRGDDAREAFEAARDRAADLRRSAVEAELGLVVCDWRDGDPQELGTRLARLSEEAGRQPPEQGGENRLDAAVAVLRLVALLREWRARPALSGAPTPADLAELEQRAREVRSADAELGDADLVEGLVRYYFALNQSERSHALDMLDRGTELAKGITLPEVLDLMERERALGGEGDAISRYLALVGEFLDDPTRSAEDRAHFRRLQARFAPFGDPGDLPDQPVPHQRTPAEDHQRRTEALRRRIELIVQPRIRDLPQDAPARLALRELLDELDHAARAAADGAGILHQAEMRLITSTAQTLLPEDPAEHRGTHDQEPA